MSAMTARRKLVECARQAARLQHLERYGYDAGVDPAYLDNASDETLRQTVKAYFRTDDVDALDCDGPFIAA